MNELNTKELAIFLVCACISIPSIMIAGHELLMFYSLFRFTKNSFAPHKQKKELVVNSRDIVLKIVRREEKLIRECSLFSSQTFSGI